MEKKLKKEGIHDHPITGRRTTDYPGLGNPGGVGKSDKEYKQYDPAERAAILKLLANFGPKPKEQSKAKKEEGVLEQVYAVQKPYSGCQLTSLIHPIDPLVGLDGSEVTPDQVHGVYHDQDQANAVAQEVYEAYCKQEEALEEKKGVVSERIKKTMSELEKRRAACVEAIKQNPMEAAKHRQEAADYASKIDELVSKLQLVEKSKKPIEKKAKKEIKESIVAERREYDQEAMEKLGFEIYPGCRSAAWEFATQELGIPADEILGKMSDDDVLNAISDSLNIMGYYNDDEEELQEALTKQDKLSSAEYQKEKKKKDFKASDWQWHKDEQLYCRKK